MDAVGITIGLAWTLLGLVFIALAYPLAKGSIKRNPYYGMRFPESFQSDEAWLAINRFGGRRMIFWSIPLLVIGVIAFTLPLSQDLTWAWILGLAPLLFTFIFAIETWLYAKRTWPISR